MSHMSDSSDMNDSSGCSDMSDNSDMSDCSYMNDSNGNRESSDTSDSSDYHVEKRRAVVLVRENPGVRGSVLHVGQTHTYVPATGSVRSTNAMPTKSPTLIMTIVQMN